MRNQAACKRVVDVLAAIAGLTILSPALLAIGVLVLLSDGAPVLFRQTRLGLRGRPFSLIKFRTMRISPGNAITVGEDARVYPLGRHLRALRLDELPQLWNLLLGEMSLIGPRPEVPEFEDVLREQASGAILLLKPGITDPASLEFRDEADRLARFQDPISAYRLKILPAKIAISLEYASRATCLSDLSILLASVTGVVRSAIRGGHGGRNR